jgi:hypothetical protein
VLGPIIYLVVTVVAGIILSFLILTFRTTKKRGDGSPFFTIFFCFLLTVVGPFIYVEVLTKAVGKKIEPAIKTAYLSSPLGRKAKYQYFRITWYTGSMAKAIAVGEERANWGGTDRPVLGVDLVRDGTTWKPKAFSVIWSDRLNKDGLVMPPYR